MTDFQSSTATESLLILAREVAQHLEKQAGRPGAANVVKALCDEVERLQQPVVPAQQTPVSYRWRQPGGKHWSYDPTPEWVEDHRHEIELEALYTSSVSSTQSGPLPDRKQDQDESPDDQGEDHLGENP